MDYNVCGAREKANKNSRYYQVDEIPCVLARHLAKMNLGSERWRSGGGGVVNALAFKPDHQAYRVDKTPESYPLTSTTHTLHK